MQLRLGHGLYVGGAFEGDGLPHTFRRYDLQQCKAACEPRFDFDVYIDGPGVASPIWLDWTLDVEVTAWGTPAVPPDAVFEVRVLPPVP